MAAYFLVTIVIGLRVGQRVITAEDYYRGDRKTPWWAITFSILATYISALSFLGGPAWAYGEGFKVMAIHVNYPLAIVVIVSIFIPFFFNSSTASIYEYFELRFGHTTRALVAIFFIVMIVLFAGSYLTATAYVVSLATGMGPRTSIVLMATVVMIYTVFGGMKAVIWTDVMQASVLFVGVGIVLVGALTHAGPVNDVVAMLAKNGKFDVVDWNFSFGNSTNVWAALFAITIYQIIVYGASQTVMQRAMVARSVGDAKKAYMAMGYTIGAAYFVFTLVGALMYVIYDGEPFDNSNEIILLFANSLAIPGLMGLIGAALLSGSMSSLSSVFNSLGTLSVVDFYQRYYVRDASEEHYLKVSRIFTLVWGLATIPVAFLFIGSSGSLLKTLIEISALGMGAKLAMFVLGFYSKHTTERGLLVGVVVGLVVLFALVFGIPFVDWVPPKISWAWYIVIGGGATIIVAWITSVVIDGFQDDWHVQTVPGQKHLFKTTGRPEKIDGWYVVPGYFDKANWGLIAFFVVSTCLIGSVELLSN